MTGPGGHHPSAISRLADLRVVVDRVEGRPVCGLKPGDGFSVSKSSQLPGHLPAPPDLSGRLRRPARRRQVRQSRAGRCAGGRHRRRRPESRSDRPAGRRDPVADNGFTERWHDSRSIAPRLAGAGTRIPPGRQALRGCDPGHGELDKGYTDRGSTINCSSADRWVWDRCADERSVSAPTHRTGRSGSGRLTLE